MVRLVAWWLGAMLLGAWLGLEAEPAYGQRGEVSVTALGFARQGIGWLSYLCGCIAVTHARRLLQQPSHR